MSILLYDRLGRACFSIELDLSSWLNWFNIGGSRRKTWTSLHISFRRVTGKEGYYHPAPTVDRPEGSVWLPLEGNRIWIWLTFGLIRQTSPYVLSPESQQDKFPLAKSSESFFLFVSGFSFCIFCISSSWATVSKWDCHPLNGSALVPVRQKSSRYTVVSWSCWKHFQDLHGRLLL